MKSRYVRTDVAVGAGVASLTLTGEGAVAEADARPVVSTHTRTDQHRTSLSPVGRKRNGAAVHNYKYETEKLLNFVIICAAHST